MFRITVVVFVTVIASKLNMNCTVVSVVGISLVILYNLVRFCCKWKENQVGITY
ncbi:hypothetical protein CLOSBL3_30039 [Clostridiaceae bacterium BL-3]|nr:hypothetical protein CLOSBL3_30039 [Clostridiaceae bacterium BL-3]